MHAVIGKFCRLYSTVRPAVLRYCYAGSFLLLHTWTINQQEKTGSVAYSTDLEFV